MKPVHATLEPNSHNTDGSTVVLYFEAEPTWVDVVSALAETTLNGSVNTDDPDFSWEEHPNALSERAGLRRVECYPAG